MNTNNLTQKNNIRGAMGQSMCSCTVVPMTTPYTIVHRRRHCGRSSTTTTSTDAAKVSIYRLLIVLTWLFLRFAISDFAPLSYIDPRPPHKVLAPALCMWISGTRFTRHPSRRLILVCGRIKPGSSWSETSPSIKQGVGSCRASQSQDSIFGRGEIRFWFTVHVYMYKPTTSHHSSPAGIIDRLKYSSIGPILSSRSFAILIGRLQHTCPSADSVLINTSSAVYCCWQT